MSIVSALEETARDCQRILNRTDELVEEFIVGKVEKKYGTTSIAQEIAAELGLGMTLVQPLVSLFITRDVRVESNRGRYNGGWAVSDQGKLYKEERYGKTEGEAI